MFATHGIIQSIQRGAAGIVTDGLVLHLDAGNSASYPGTGTTWTDLSGNGYNGTLINGPTYDSANGGSIVFDGSDDRGDITFSWPTVFTLNLWLYPISSQNELDRILGSSSFRFELAISNSRKISYYFPFTSWVENVTTLSASSWTNIVFINNNGSSTIYLNNISSYSGSSASADTSTIVTIASRVGGTENSNFKLSNMQVYNRALSAAEIETNFNALKSRYGL